ncbi:amidase signature domain-containing protein [Mycena vulgaris]|nr:amidase signature domain-containing protein [Mycena vulgaris]
MITSAFLLAALLVSARAQDTPTWKKTVDAKVAARDALIPAEYLVPADRLPAADVLDVSKFPQESGWFTDCELAITESTASEVVAQIKRGHWTAAEVLEATIKRTVVAQQLFNPLSEIVFERARATAQKLDDYYTKTGKTIGPLHGLPISLKDQWRFKGVDATIGYVSWANQPAAEDSLGVTALESLGAVLYVKTNIPTALMAGETENNIFNTTMNPFNRRLTPGGSSGGESALVGFKGSFIGFGTDIGGSIRIPATNGGLYALRPSVGRCTYQNMANSLRGLEAVTSTCGPMGRSAEDIHLVMSSLVGTGAWTKDFTTLPIPWRKEHEKLPKKLSFAWANGDGLVQPWPPLQRAMKLIRTKLEKEGHEVLDWTPPGWAAANTVFGGAQGVFNSDAHQDIQTAVNASGEPFPSVISSYGAWIAPENRSTVYEAWNLVGDLRNYTAYYREQWLLTANTTSTGRPFDGLIMPATSFVAKERGSAYAYGYQNLSPFLDLSTGVFPVTRVNSSIDVVNASFVPLTDSDATNQALYDDPTRWENAPVGLQVIGQRLEEEKIVALLGVISKALGHSC